MEHVGHVADVVRPAIRVTIAGPDIVGKPSLLPSFVDCHDEVCEAEVAAIINLLRNHCKSNESILTTNDIRLDAEVIDVGCCCLAVTSTRIYR